MLDRLFRIVDGLPGVYDVFRRLAGAIPAGLCRARLFAVVEILLGSASSRTIAPGTPAAGDVQIRWVTSASELVNLGRLSPPDVLSAWDGVSRRCAVAWVGHAPVALVWLASNDFLEQGLGLKWVLAPDELWLFGAHVRRGYRGHGIFQALLRFVLEDVRDRGAARLLLAVTAGNRPSRRASDRLGNRVAVMLAVAGCGGQRQWGTGGVERVPPSAANRGARVDCWRILADT